MSDRKDGSFGWIMFTLLVVGSAMFASLQEVTQHIGPASIPIWIAALVAVGVVLRGPLGEALAQRLRGGSPAGDAAELEELRQRMAELEAGQQRLPELEERLDFAERLLAQREAVQLPRGPER